VVEFLNVSRLGFSAELSARLFDAERPHEIALELIQIKRLLLVGRPHKPKRHELDALRKLGTGILKRFSICSIDVGTRETPPVAEVNCSSPLAQPLTFDGLSPERPFDQTAD
jgi:hypothetical protein